MLIRRTEDAGTWLYRRRSHLPALLVVLYLPLLPDPAGPSAQGTGTHLWTLSGLGIAFLGFGIRALTAGFLPGGTSGRSRQSFRAESLNTTGLYSVVRHPLYLGNFFIWVGVALFTRHPWLVLLTILAFWLFYGRIIRSEDRFLAERFGERFRAWASVTPAFIPRLSRFEGPSLPFSPRSVLGRESNGVFGAVLAMVTLDSVLRFSSEGSSRPHPFALGVLGAAFLGWLGLRAVKKWTSFLTVEGR
jgi:protein-S-isoprenylcysteine O-methyltransferase Ste14